MTENDRDDFVRTHGGITVRDAGDRIQRPSLPQVLVPVEMINAYQHDKVPAPEVKPDLGDMGSRTQRTDGHPGKIPASQDPVHIQRAGDEARNAAQEKGRRKEKSALTAATARAPGMRKCSPHPQYSIYERGKQIYG